MMILTPELLAFLNMAHGLCHRVELRVTAKYFDLELTYGFDDDEERKAVERIISREAGKLDGVYNVTLHDRVEVGALETVISLEMR